jgi:hypothetical protein
VEGLRREHVASHLQVFTILCTTFFAIFIPVACLCFGSMCVHPLLPSNLNVCLCLGVYERGHATGICSVSTTTTLDMEESLHAKLSTGTQTNIKFGMDMGKNMILQFLSHEFV